MVNPESSKKFTVLIISLPSKLTLLFYFKHFNVLFDEMEAESEATKRRILYSLHKRGEKKQTSNVHTSLVDIDVCNEIDRKGYLCYPLVRT